MEPWKLPYVGTTFTPDAMVIDLSLVRAGLAAPLEEPFTDEEAVHQEIRAAKEKILAGATLHLERLARLKALQDQFILARISKTAAAAPPQAEGPPT